MLRACAAQVSLQPGQVDANLTRCLRAVKEAHEAGADLLVLPECALSGYILDEGQAQASAVRLEGPELRTFADAVQKAGNHAVIGFLECDGDALYNASALMGPEGTVAHYRKRHIPFVGVDRFVHPGAPVGPVIADATIGRIGLNICYDIRFPESARTVALAGAEVLAQPTNWPRGAEVVASYFPVVRATENRVFMVVANRGDAENGVEYIGMSQIVAPSGDVLARAERGEAMLVADLPLQQARQKRIVVEPGVYEIDLWGDRRPEMYESLAHRVVDSRADDVQAK
jgi:predicted amidohydrolase